MNIQSIISNWDDMAIYPCSDVQLMQPFIQDAILRLLVQNDYKEYIKSCEKKMDLPEEIHSFATDHGISISTIWDTDNPYSSEEWHFSLPSIFVGNMKFNFAADLQISKVIPMFEINHGFTIEANDALPFTEILGGALSGCQSDPYSRSQFEFFYFIVNYLFNKKYYLTTYNASSDVITVPDTFKLKKDDGSTDHVTLGGLFYGNSLNIYSPS